MKAQKDFLENFIVQNAIQIGLLEIVGKIVMKIAKLVKILVFLFIVDFLKKAKNVKTNYKHIIKLNFAKCVKILEPIASKAPI